MRRFRNIRLQFGIMAGKISVFLIALLATNVFSIPEGKLKRSYKEHGTGDDPVGYGIQDRSDERDASIEDNVPCGLLDNSGSREHGYGLHKHPIQGHHRGVSTSVKAAAAASASSYS